MTSYVFSADQDHLDRARVHAWLAEESYWAKGRPRDKQESAIDHSLNFGMYVADESGVPAAQVAYARVVTDHTTFAWLADVFVDTSHRGTGLGKELITNVLAALEPMELRRVLLKTNDAHGLYEQYGFAPVKAPGDWMVHGTQ
ncbi:MAG: GNAT family N-acetyltransferase [Propionibacteriales bacterium]|nr:GNAT family N-acetyltransferase [Propionibacteriales bacterium]